MVFNVALVLAAVVGALVLPANGRSVLALVVLAACYAGLALVFTVVTRGLDLDAGTESLQAQPV
jgi:hypothetical protein